MKPLNEFTLEEGLDLRKLQTTGSILHINEHIDEDDTEPSSSDRLVDLIGHKLGSFDELAHDMIDINLPSFPGFVKKKILEEGGGLPLKEPCAVSFAYSGYLENAEEPFDNRSPKTPLTINLQMIEYEEHGLIPGLDIALKSMLVGELSLFLVSYEVAYGEFGIPPRIPPKSKCAFYVKLIKCILNPESRKINFRESGMYDKIEREVKKLYIAGSTLFESNNFTQAVSLFRKAIWMLHKCRLADESEQRKQEKWLIKLYYNSAICYNKANLPLKACTACNELNLLRSLWNNCKALFQNAKALRMIGQFDAAEKRLQRAKALCSNPKYKTNIDAEIELLKKTKESCIQQKLIGMKLTERSVASEDFKREVDDLIKNFKANPNLCQLVLPSGMGTSERKYLKEACIRENLFMNTVDVPIEADVVKEGATQSFETTLVIDKEDDTSSEEQSEVSPSSCGDEENLEA